MTADELAQLVNEGLVSNERQSTSEPAMIWLADEWQPFQSSPVAAPRTVSHASKQAGDMP